MIASCCVFFFFSSRRRHTRCSRDWSSDVCSSDLASVAGGGRSRRRLVDPEGAAELAADALGLCPRGVGPQHDAVAVVGILGRSEEHTSELQSRLHLVCRLLLEKKKKKTETHTQL